MPACCVPYCSNRTEKGIRLFMLPQGDRNTERREAWIKNINRDDLSSKAQICEVHFTYDQFENHREDGKRTLKNNAMPTLFNEHKQLQFNKDNAKGTRRSTRKRKPIVFEEYQSGDEDLESSQSNSIKNEIKAEESSDDKIAQPIKQIELIRCRTCLTTAPKEISHVLRKLLLGKTIKQVILICVPQMELLDDEYICDKCYRFLLKLMVFIDNCLDSEEQLGTGKISLNVTSNDLAGVNKTTNLPKKKGRPRKCPIVSKESDKDYEPDDIFDKIPRKRGRKRKIDILEDKEKEEHDIEGPIVLKWGIPITEVKTVTVRKYGKTKVSNDHLAENNNDSLTVIIDPNSDSNNELNDPSGESNNKLNGSSGESIIEKNVPSGESNRELNVPGVKSNNVLNASIVNIEHHDETEIFKGHMENNIFKEPLEQTNSILESFIIEEKSPKESENTSKIVSNDHSYVPEDLVQLLRCPLCITDYRTLRGIKLHLTSAHKIAEEQSFKCSLCNMKFIRYKDLVKHKNVHGYACELCEDFFPTVTDLNSHRTIHPERYCCMKCGEKFQKKALLEKHVPLHLTMSKIRALIKNRTKPILQCPHCNLKCGYASALQQHIQSVHLKIKEFACGVCHKKFSTSNSLLIHVRVRHSTDTPYVCKQCGVGYERLDYLQRHEQTHLVKQTPFVNPAKRNYSKVTTKEKTLSCNFCPVKTSSKQELLVHLQTHNGLKKFECKHCGLILSCPRTKLFHERTHKNSHICTTCSKNFSTEQELKMHEDLKECMSQTFTCIICDSTYTRQVLLETHILNDHVNKILNSIDKEIDLIEVNRRNIEMEWSTDEEEEMEETEVNKVNNEIDQNTNNKELNQEHINEKGECILVMDEDSVVEKAVESGDYHTEQDTPVKTEVEYQKDIESKQDIKKKQNLKLEEESECMILIDQNI